MNSDLLAVTVLNFPLRHTLRLPFIFPIINILIVQDFQQNILLKKGHPYTIRFLYSKIILLFGLTDILSHHSTNYLAEPTAHTQKLALLLN